MRSLLALTLVLLPDLAAAHPGHLIEVAGHDHLVAGIALGVALGVALWGALHGRRDAENETDAEDEADEAAADQELQDA